ncbi:hypothetical protein [Aerococcus viridans]|uniref:hypothetical protein n=2 Tax=Aerococcus TaxID=1375 RepID=UPI003B21449A
MRNRNKRWLYSGFIASVMSLLHVMLEMWFPNPSFQAILGDGLAVQQGFYYPALFIIYLVIYTFMTYAYYLVDFRLPGTKGTKVTLYVISELLIFLVYRAEPMPHLVEMDWVINPIKAILIFMVQGQLIYRLMARQRLMYKPKPFFYTRGLHVYILVFAIMRLVAYLGLDIYGPDDGQLPVAILWSGIMGLAIGLSFGAIQRYIIRQNQIGKTNQFALQFFAWIAVGNYAMVYLRYDVGIFDLLARLGLDIAAVWIATFIVLHWQINERTPIYPLDTNSQI